MPHSASGSSASRPSDSNERKVRHRHLEVFRAVMRSGSITGASRLLGMSQPGVSKLIAQTEERCGFQLFDRVQGRLQPTDRARRLFDEAERLFVGMEEINRLVGRMGDDGPSRTVITAVPIIAQQILPRAIAQWLQTAETRPFVTTRDAGGVVALVAARNADIGVTTSFRRLPGMRSQLIARNEAMCALHEDHPLARKAALKPEDFHGVPFISLSRHEGQQEKFDKIFAEAGVDLNEVAEMPLMLGAAAMAHARIGVTFADYFSAQPWLDKGLVLRPFKPRAQFEYHAIWTENLYRGREVHALVAALLSVCRDLIADAKRA
ncbi:LysR substrate-binding domain-containing protein [Jiella sonneratiae]|uniref:LysR family transcriptional regulator n=1 Tax=Jiella sonneratiae TaxID=2816856 RepID=A0ABS3J594_9HYPH|nr:LysR substrate-binding domain-containing protein [Jiella sonneratiae]MBO0904252.1 LysR family transcriptional regulator [Jiella sonneratiae]